jgi:hypothetical protein
MRHSRYYRGLAHVGIEQAVAVRIRSRPPVQLPLNVVRITGTGVGAGRGSVRSGIRAPRARRSPPAASERAADRVSRRAGNAQFLAACSWASAAGDRLHGHVAKRIFRAR